MKNDYRAPLDSLIDTWESPIRIQDPSNNLVLVEFPWPMHGVLKWTLNGFPATVHQHEQQLAIDSDLLLVEGQILKCQVFVHDVNTIQQRLQDLWLPRWMKHADTPSEQWDRILRFCQAYLPRGRMDLPDRTHADWIGTVKHFKTHTSAGPDGWSRSDLMHTPTPLAMDVISLYQTIEDSAIWPKQWTQALVKCLEKKQNASTVNDYRPITLFCIHYRAWARHRSRQCLQFLNRFADDYQCGYASDHEAADIWYHVQTMIEVGLTMGQGVHGVVGDLIKAFNQIPREPCWQIMKLLGMPDSLLGCWKSFLTDLERRFVVRNSCGHPLISRTGYAEGCPMSCTAMCALDIAWHAYQRKFSQLSTPLSFVDNFEVIGSNAGSVLHGLEVMKEWCFIIDMQLDERKLIAWSTQTSGRKFFRDAGLKVEYGGRDLGGQCNYGAKIRNSPIVDRMKAVDPYFLVLRRSSRPAALKKHCIRGALLPRGLHGCEGVQIGDQHFVHFGAGIMKALHWNRSGASQKVRLGLLNTAEVDPGYFQFFRCLSLFRRQCLRFPSLRSKWLTFLLHRHQCQTPGPFAKLYDQLQQVHWRLDEKFNLWLDDRASIPFLTCSLDLLKSVALQSWRDSLTSHIRSRAGYDGLHGFDAQSLKFVDSHFSPTQIELLNSVRDGSFFCGVHLSKMDHQVPYYCASCGEPDDAAHRYTRCPKYAPARLANSEILSAWPALPDCLRLHGLAPDNPFRALAWQALCCLKTNDESIGNCTSSASCLNIFLDGTSSQPTTPEASLAAWAFVVADESTLRHGGHVQGICQSISRAEISALLYALKWAQAYEGQLHIWSDSQFVVEGVRRIQQNNYIPPDFDHQDLWEPIFELLSSLKCRVRIHKIASHHQTDCLHDPVADWASDWNADVDAYVKEINNNRPSWFIDVWEKYISYWQRNRTQLLQLARLHLAIAEIDLRKTSPVHDDQETEEDMGLQLLMVRQCEPLETHIEDILDDLPLDWLHSLSQQTEFGFSALSRLLSWALTTERGAACLTVVSYVELFVSFRLSLGQPIASICHSAGGNMFLSHTFASELRIFKALFRVIMPSLQISQSPDMVDLSDFGIDVPVRGVFFPWSCAEFQLVGDVLKAFAGRRRVRGIQGFARPFSV